MTLYYTLHSSLHPSQEVYKDSHTHTHTSQLHTSVHQQQVLLTADTRREIAQASFSLISGCPSRRVCTTVRAIHNLH